MPPRYQARPTDLLTRVRNEMDALGRPGMAGTSRLGSNRGREGGRGQSSVLSDLGGQEQATGQGQMLVLSATADSIASGGDYLTFDTEVYRHGFDAAIGADGQTITWPVGAVGEVKVDFAWDTYQDGGTIELEVDDMVPGFGSLVSGNSGQRVSHARDVHIAAGAQVRLKVTQSSGSAQTTGTVVVQFAVHDPADRDRTFDYEAVILADDPIGYWKLDETSGTTATDSSGNGYDGSYQSAPTLGVLGLMRDGSGATCADFNGSNQGVLVGDPAALRFDGTVPFSVMTWVTFDTFNASGFNVLVGKQQATSGAGWELLVLSSGELIFNRTTGTGTKAVSTAAGVIATGTKYCIHATFDGATGRLYVDGALTASADISGSMLASAGYSLAIGYDATSADHYVDGRQDEVAAFDREITAAEAQEHYAVGTQAA